MKTRKYEVFTITAEDIQDAIKQTWKQLKTTSENETEFKQNRKIFREMKKAIAEHPNRHYKQIMENVMKEFQEIEYKFHGRFFQVIENYMTSTKSGEDEQA